MVVGKSRNSADIRVAGIGCACASGGFECHISALWEFLTAVGGLTRVGSFFLAPCLLPEPLHAVGMGGLRAWPLRYRAQNAAQGSLPPGPSWRGMAEPTSGGLASVMAVADCRAVSRLASCHRGKRLHRGVRDCPKTPVSSAAGSSTLLYCVL